MHRRAAALWDEGLILVYRLLFILKLESAADPACAFSFASTSLWRDALSPNRALGPLVRRLLEHGHDTGQDAGGRTANWCSACFATACHAASCR